MSPLNTVGSYVGNVSGGTPIPVFGTNFNLQEFWSAANNSMFGGSGGSQNYAAPFLLGSVASAGGFYLEMYAGIGRFTASANPAFFIGLCQNPIAWSFGGAGTHAYVGSTNINGIIVDTLSGGALAATWSTIQQNGAAAPTVAAIAGLAPAGGQLFALRFQAPPNSNVITFDLKQLTALGTWTSIIAGATFNSSPAGTRLAPTMVGCNNTAGGASNGIILHRLFGVTDTAAVPKAF
jgi:hypothetical protein